MGNQGFLASKIKQKIATALDCVVPQPEPHQKDGPPLGATQKRCTVRQMIAAGNDYFKEKVLFPVPRQFFSLLVMQHVRKICFKNALAVAISMQYNMAIFWFDFHIIGYGIWYI